MTSENITSLDQPDARVRTRIGQTTTHFAASLCGRRYDRCRGVVLGLRCSRDAGHDGGCQTFEVRS